MNYPPFLSSILNPKRIEKQSQGVKAHETILWHKQIYTNTWCIIGIEGGERGKFS